MRNENKSPTGRKPLETKEVFDYPMWFKGEIRILPKIILTKNNFDDRWVISVAEISRLKSSYFLEITRWWDGKNWIT